MSSSTEIVESYTPNFEAWISEFQEWQTRIGFDPSWLGDYTFDIKFDWDTAGDSIEFGDFEGMPKWERRMQVPQQNIRDAIISMVTVQGDTEFASVEQQHHLLESAPTEYDRKSALRIMCEEQRHGWQMAYVLCTFFGEQGVREAMKLLERNSMGNPFVVKKTVGEFSVHSTNPSTTGWISSASRTSLIEMVNSNSRC